MIRQDCLLLFSEDDIAMNVGIGICDNVCIGDCSASALNDSDALRENAGGTENNEKNLTTVCYLERNGKYLMLHRTKKKNDTNRDKLIGIGGHFHHEESPEECMLREMKEECGIVLTDMRMRGLVTFVSDVFGCEYMFLFSATKYEGNVATDCNEGNLEWIEKNSLLKSEKIWAGDRIFLKLLEKRDNFFSLKLTYKGEKLEEVQLDGVRQNQEFISS